MSFNGGLLTTFYRISLYKKDNQAFVDDFGNLSNILLEMKTSGPCCK